MKTIAALAILCAALATTAHAGDKAPSFLETGKAYMFFTDSGEPAVSGVVQSLTDYPWVAVQAGTKRGTWTQYVNMEKVSGIRPTALPE